MFPLFPSRTSRWGVRPLRPAFPRAKPHGGFCAGQFCFCCSRSARWQVFHRIDRPALGANLKMQLHPVGVGIAHFRNLLPFTDLLAFLDEQLAVVRVNGDEIGRQIGRASCRERV